MRKIIIFLLSICITLLFSCGNTKTTLPEFQNGDIIFQTSESQQCEAVRIATNSKFSHCGILFIEKGKHTYMKRFNL